ncbi:MAG: septum formation protein Maf [Chlorobi bacterium]|nr:septum formation protein Maf [Chlorobiota bacterium]
MLDNLLKYKIILASKSPRRYELLKDLGVNFEVKTDFIALEEYPLNLKNEEVVLFLAKKKADYFLNKLEKNNLLITADTIVVLNNSVLNKPENREHAYEMLKQISGTKNTVITGVCITTIEKTKLFFAKTNVYFKHLTSDEINYYIDKYQPFDKAGAYGIQEWIGFIGIEKIEGSYFNVMGLPTQMLYKELQLF